MKQQMAIIGMDAHFGTSEGLEDFYLNCRSIIVPFNSIIHTKYIKPEYERILAMHTLPVNDNTNTHFYSNVQQIF